MSKPTRQAIKIPANAYGTLKKLAAHAARHGWSAFGIDRTDPPTQTALIDEAIKLLDQRKKDVARRRRKK